MRPYDRRGSDTYPEIPGLYPRRRRLPNWPVWLWIVVAIVAAIPLVGLPGVVLARYTTSDSAYCLTCHATGETPNRAPASAVHPGYGKVTCVDCHAKPNQVVFEGYIKGFMAEPERVSGNCLRCHSAIPRKTDQAGFKFNEAKIAINHQAHVERGATCTACHSNVAHDLRAQPTNKPTMESCYSCHSKTESCMTCHQNGIPTVAKAKDTVGRKPVAPPRVQTAAASPVGQQSQEGKEAYARTCAACHGPDGSAFKGANLKSKSYLESYSGEPFVKATAEGKGAMPPFGSAKGGPLTDPQIRAIYDYLLGASS